MEVVARPLALPLAARPMVPVGGIKWWARTFFLWFLVIVTGRVFSVSHILEIIGVIEGVGALLFGVWLGWRFIERCTLNDWKINSVEIISIFLMLVPLWSAINAQRVFGQPFIYGVAAFKDYYLFIGALHIYRLLRQGFFTLQMLEQAFLMAAWMAVIYFYLASLFIDPGPWLDTPLAGANDIKGVGVYYRFNMSIIFFGAIYYTARAFMRKEWICLLYALIFMCYVVFFRVDRTSIVVMLAGAAGAAFFHSNVRILARTVLLAILPGLLAIVLLVQMAPDVVDQYSTMFTDAMNTVLGSKDGGNEISVRTYEVLIAEKYIERDPMLGSGRMGSQWIEGGYEHFLGYFYPADVGYIGIAFMYGWPVTILLYAQFLVAGYFFLRTKGRGNDVFFVTCKFLLFSFCLDSVTNGFITQFAGQVLLITCIGHHYGRLHRPAEA